MSGRVILSAVFAFALAAGAANAKDVGAISGKAYVVDANVIAIAGQKIRLYGIDAPDRGQSCQSAGGAAYPCGRRAAFALDAMVRGKLVSCAPRGIAKDRLIMATCSLAGLDLASAMVEAGWAVVNIAFAPEYAETEAVAKAAKVGLWSGLFQDPMEWRATHGTPPA